MNFKFDAGYAYPTIFNLDIYPDTAKGYHQRISVKVEYDTKMCEVYTECVFGKNDYSEEQIKAALKYVEDGVKSGAIHLPLFIPFEDIQNADNYEGVCEHINAYD